MSENANKKLVAASLLASGYSLRVVAQKVGVSERQIGRWRDEPAFRAKINKIQSTYIEQTANLLTTLTTSAVQRLGQFLNSDDSRIACNAASQILKYTLAYRDGVTTEARLLALEAGKVLKPVMAGQSAKGKKSWQRKKRKRKSDDETAS